ncbi:CoA-binding protein [bacterium]|nr:CoA-binding protein [bacterium]
MPSDNTIAIIGASSNREKFGNTAVLAYRDQGFTVYPVNARADEIEGLKCYRDIRDIPGPVETASVYLPPKLTLDVLDAIAEKKVNQVFLNPGSENEAVIEKANQLGLNIIQGCSIIAAGKSPADYKE